jgi:CheY-like chemotaxis protein
LTHPYRAASPATVLLVDDDDGIREVLRLYAAHHGLEVVGEATDGRQAVDMAARLRPDVIVLDHEMPELTGIDALPRLRRRAPHSIIVVYAAAGPGLEKTALGLGASAYLTKLATPKTAISLVVALLPETDRSLAR